ncbi:MAG: PfkB family carbohydrate kinase [Candidatus Aminicenantes bacterium]|nr:PfkB family carbohydrate kinase [Candidatus Aminicenantes bacterium]
MNEETRYLFRIIDTLSHLQVAVWGDFILDEYITGCTRRISREAPVLILAFQKREFALGGAGNALLNLLALGVDAVPIGVVGDDEAGRTIASVLQSAGADTQSLFTAPGFATPLKTRVLAGEDNTKKQQILRIDREGHVPETAGLKKKLRAALAKAGRTADALLISDYHYATVQTDLFPAVLADFKAKGRPVTLDSRFRLLQFPGVTLATPNEPEVEDALKISLAAGEPAVRKAGAALLRKLRSPALLITRGSKGMALFEKGKLPLFLSASGPSDIVDVTGAGDTVISVLTAALAGGASPADAARLANGAGGVVVMKKGTATISPLELKQALISEP